MIIYPLNVRDLEDLEKICSRIKTDSRAIAYLYPKSNIFHFFAEKVDYRAASFLKQELLARGGDTIVTKHVIDGKTDFSDVLLMGTSSQLKSLLEKLKSMDCWGLKEFRESLKEFFSNIQIKNWEIKSPNGHEIKLDNNTKIMSIMNLTPDSFYEESRITEKEIIERAEKFLSEGAEILDLGAESTRPDSERISEEEELRRLLEPLRILRKNFPDALISIDTYKSKVAKISVNEGADIINDVSGFEIDEKLPEVLAELKVPYVLSYFRGNKENILGDMLSYLNSKLKILKDFGVKSEKIILDPGLGFGKEKQENYEIIKNIESLKIFGLPILVGHSRKRLTEKNLSRTLAISSILAGRVNILRVHDVKENFEALSMVNNLHSC